MGSTIPHGDRLHECNDRCQEASVIPKIKVYEHDNGRHCQLGPDNVWRHWDHPVPEPGPKEVVDYVCRMDHNIMDTKTMSAGEVHGDQEFGFPALGKAASGVIAEMGDYAWPFSPGDVFQIPVQVRDNGLPEYTMKVSPIGVSFDFGENGVNTDFATDEARIIFDALPNLLLDFLGSNEKYARAQTHDLGLKGIVPDVNRKVSAIITRIWDGVDAGRDSTEELIGDTIGHLLLMLGKLKKEQGGGSPQAEG